VGRGPVWKEGLLTYNAEDCAALRKVTEFVQAVGEVARRRGETGGDASASGPAVAWADEVSTPSSRREWCRIKFAIPDLDYVNRCAWFDYQRGKVFLRTCGSVRRACLCHNKRRKPRKLPVNREVEVRGIGSEVVNILRLLIALCSVIPGHYREFAKF
jgi:hypothetical protein